MQVSLLLLLLLLLGLQGLTLVDCGDRARLIDWLTPAHAVVPDGFAV